MKRVCRFRSFGLALLLALTSAMFAAPAWAAQYRMEDEALVMGILDLAAPLPADDAGWAAHGVAWSGTPSDADRRVVSLVVSGKVARRELDVSGLAALTFLKCDNNALTALDASGLTALTTLSCNDNALTTLDVRGLTALTYLDCGGNALTALDASALTALEELYCHDNALTRLDVNGLTALRALYCYDNALTALDVSGLAALAELDCDSNALAKLDVKGLTALTTLHCYGNALTTLDAGGLTALTELRCSGNVLTMLDVRGLTALTWLACSENALTTLDVSGLTALTELYCYGNRPPGSDEPELGLVMSPGMTVLVNPDWDYPATAAWAVAEGAPEGIVEVSSDKLTLRVAAAGDPVTLASDVTEYTDASGETTVAHAFALTVYTATMPVSGDAVSRYRNSPRG